MGIKSCSNCQRRWYGISKKMQEIGANFALWYCLEHRKLIGKHGTDDDLKKAEGCEKWMK